MEICRVERIAFPNCDEHPAENLLVRFMRNEVSGEERRWVVRHLLPGCPRCTEVTSRIWNLAEETPEASSNHIQVSPWPPREAKQTRRMRARKT